MAATDTAPQASSDMVSGFNNLDILRQAGLMVGIAASVALGFWIVLLAQETDYKPLYSSMERMDSKEIGQILDFNEIIYKVDTKTGALLVEASRIQDARIKLAEAGVPTNNTVGFELLDQEQPFGTSAYAEKIRYRRSLEGELARTITNINSVRKAKVHLAIPKASVFVRDGREPSASVFIDLFPGRDIQTHQVRGIANLVASSIPELTIANVSVIDQKGRLLSVGVEDKELVIAAQHLDYTRKMEQDIVLRIRRLLTPIIGLGRFKAEVNADVDFTEVEQAEESFNPDLPSIRSERTVSETRNGGATNGGIPGALTNQPKVNGQAPEVAGPGGAGGGEESLSNSRSQSTKNYELDRTVSYTKHEKGRLRRLNVAVVVDDKIIKDSDGKPTRAPWTATEIERIGVLVRDAVGFSPARGDSVNILNESFIEFEEEVLPEPQWYEDIWDKPVIRQLGSIFAILFLFIAFIKPILKSLATSGAKAKVEDETRELAALQAAGVDSFDSLSDETVTLTGGDALALPSPEESYERQLNTVKGLVAEDPGRVAQVVKRWINEE